MSTLAGELRKLPAFVRRDFLVAWSYRLPFVGDWIGLALQAFMFYFVGLMVDPSKLPTLRRGADHLHGVRGGRDRDLGVHDRSRSAAWRWGCSRSSSQARSSRC